MFDSEFIDYGFVEKNNIDVILIVYNDEKKIFKYYKEIFNDVYLLDDKVMWFLFWFVDNYGKL